MSAQSPIHSIDLLILSTAVSEKVTMLRRRGGGGGGGGEWEMYSWWLEHV